MKEKCIICEKEFETIDKPRWGGRKEIKRPHKSITCSPQCSRVYGRIYRKVRGNYENFQKNK